MTDKNPTLLARLEQLAKNAYSPYSKIKISVLIRDEFDNYHPGVNIENASYPMGCCAEASALSHLITAGSKSICELWLYNCGSSLITPCGGCRQKIIEFSKPSCLVHCWTSSNLIKNFTLSELLPFAFSKTNIKII